MKKLPPNLRLTPEFARYLTPPNLDKDAEPFQIRLGLDDGRCLARINLLRNDMDMVVRPDGMWVVVESTDLLRFVLTDFNWTPTEFHRFDFDECG